MHGLTGWIDIAVGIGRKDALYGTLVQSRELECSPTDSLENKRIECLKLGLGKG